MKNAESILQDIESELGNKGYINSHGRNSDGSIKVIGGSNAYVLLYDIRAPKYCTLMIGNKVVQEGAIEAVLEYVRNDLPRA